MEKLRNCPNCAGILDDFGKCQYCGSRVYDLCDIDMRGHGSRGKGRSYIRIKTDKFDVIAPVCTNSVIMQCSLDSLPTMNVEFIICGETQIQGVQHE